MLQFASTAANETLTDILLIGVIDVDEAPPRYYQTQGGPLCFQFLNGSFIVEQPLGKESIQFANITLENWIARRQENAPDYRLATFSVFELFCYRRNAYDPTPRIDRIVGYRQSDEADDYCGLLLDLSTGGCLGIDASSDEGLRYFLNGHKRIFEREYVAPMGLKQHIVWDRQK